MTETIPPRSAGADQKAELERDLRRTRGKHRKATDRLEAARVDLYDAMRTARAAGLSVRVIATAADVAPGLVQQVTGAPK